MGAFSEAYLLRQAFIVRVGDVHSFGRKEQLLQRNACEVLEFIDEKPDELQQIILC